MFLKASKFRALMNGGAEKAGIVGLKDEIIALEKLRADLLCEADGFPAQRQAAHDSDDFQAKLEEIASREEKVYAQIAHVDHQMAGLRARLPVIADKERQARWKELRGQIEDADSVFVKLARDTLAAFEQSISLRSTSRAAGFEREIGQAFPMLPILGQGCAVNAYVLDLFEAEAARLRAAPVTAGAAVPSRASQPVTRDHHSAAVPSPQPAGMGRGAVLLDGPGRSASRHGAERPAAVPRRAPQTFAGKEGDVAVIIVRDGYETPHGEQCIVNDRVFLPPQLARSVVENGAGEFAEKQP